MTDVNNLPLLPNLGYFVGFKCNLTCHGCSNYSNHMVMYKKELPNYKEDFEAFKPKFRVGRFYLIGGEPLLNPDIKDIITRAFEFSTTVRLITNGLSLKNNLWVYDILQNHPNFDIYISYHQSRENVGKTKYDQMLFESICEFLEKNNYTKFRYTPEKLLAKINYFKDKDLYFLKSTEGFPIIQRMNMGLQFHGWNVPALDENDIPIPYNSDYVKAKTKFCQCPTPHLHDKKLHKCHMTFLLPKLLKQYNVYDDRWTALKNYKPFDLQDKFNDSFYNLLKPEPVCSICPDNPKEFGHPKIDKHSKIMNIFIE